MKLQGFAWFALTDTDSCRLLCCGMTRRGKYQVEEYETLVNTLRANQTLANGDMTQDVEDKVRRFAGEIMLWLETKVKEHKIGAMPIFAAPHMRGVLMTARTHDMGGLLGELEGNLMHLKARQLADHPMIRELVRSMGSDRRAVIEAANLLRNARKKRSGHSMFE